MFQSTRRKKKHDLASKILVTTTPAGVNGANDVANPDQVWIFDVSSEPLQQAVVAANPATNAANFDPSSVVTDTSANSIDLR